MKFPTEYVQYNTSTIFNSLLKGCGIEQANTNCTRSGPISESHETVLFLEIGENKL